MKDPTLYAESASRGASRFRALGMPRRFDRGSLWVIALALALVLVSGAQRVYRLTLPTDGFLTTTDIASNVPIFDENLLGQPSPLRMGDIFVALEGVPYEQLRRGALRFRRVAGTTLQAGETVRYTVLRQGERLELDVPLYHWTTRGLGRLLWVSLLSPTWLGLAIALFVFWKLPNNATARLMLLFYSTELAILISRLGVSLSVTDLATPAAYWFAIMLGHAIYGYLEAPLLLHLCLTFPNSKGWLRRRPWLLAVIYGLPWMLLPVDALTNRTPALMFALVGSYLPLGALALGHTFVSVTDPVGRAQVRWFAFGFALLSLSGFLYTLQFFGLLPVALTHLSLSRLALTVCLAVAILYYRLFDLEWVINRSLVYLALSASVVLLYVLVVSGLGALFSAQRSTRVTLLATGVVAVLFQPLRDRLQRIVNRLMYGERDRPYALLSTLSQKIEGALTPEEVVPTILETVSHTLKLPYASVILYHQEGAEVLVEYGHPSARPAVFPLVYQGETFGELRLTPRAVGESFTPAELQLLRTIAQQASVAAYTVRQNVELRRSRERLIAAREEERLRIRRDLHDGLGPTLAGLTLQTGALAPLIRCDPDAAATAVSELQGELRRATHDIRRLVHDLRPPALDQLGFAEALRQLVAGLSEQPGGPSFSLEIPLLPPLSAATEVAAYRIVQEASTNALKHAQARAVTIRLAAESSDFKSVGVKVTVRDNGRGLPDPYRAGVGLHSMRERAEELGGSLKIISTSATGTEVHAWLPCTQN